MKRLANVKIIIRDTILVSTSEYWAIEMKLVEFRNCLP